MDGLLMHNPLLAILSHIFFIAISFYALQSLMPEKVIRKHHVFQAQLLFILLSVVIGSIVSNAFLSLSFWSSQIPNMF